MCIFDPNSKCFNHFVVYAVCYRLNSDIKNQVRHLVRRFTLRTGKMRKRIEMPPTPSTTSSSQSRLTRNRINMSSMPRDAASPTQSPTHATAIFKADEQHPHHGSTFTCKLLCSGIIDPQGSLYISWLCIVSMTFLYNAWVIPLRSTFPFQTPENTSVWLTLDFCADVIYLLDIIFVKHRVSIALLISSHQKVLVFFLHSILLLRSMYYVDLFPVRWFLGPRSQSNTKKLYEKINIQGTLLQV